MSSQSPTFEINGKLISESSPTYFIADIAASHDGDLSRAIDLIYLSKEMGADAAKFQHFEAKTIVSDFGFRSLGSQLSHQSKWKKSVYEVYDDASVPFEWTQKLKDAAEDAGIDFFTSPYSLDLVDRVEDYVCAYKIGSGDITWHEIIRHIAAKQKPYILATGASNMNEVDAAVKSGLSVNKNFCLMQCNTNYTASIDNFNYINLNVIREFKKEYPNIILGLSDHTPGHATVLGAVALGARVIEKHFTDDNNREGPDHLFSMNPASWEEMVVRTRELESALGDGRKIVEDNEKETVILQRRAIAAKIPLKEGAIISNENVFPLRPIPDDGIPPYDLNKILGKRVKRDYKEGEYFKLNDLE
jgi:N-acetylneuraminate synthase